MVASGANLWFRGLELLVVLPTSRERLKMGFSHQWPMTESIVTME